MMEKAPALDPMPLYEFCMVAFYNIVGVLAPGTPMVPTPLSLGMLNARGIDVSDYEDSELIMKHACHSRRKN